MKLNDKGESSAGKLSIVGTPIGNLGDISKRAIDAINSADVILCEDTRRARKLISALGIGSKKLIVINSHTENSQLLAIEDLLNNGSNIVLTSDAGMPTVSDPGQPLINHLTTLNYRVEVVPGPCSVSSALALSGFESSRYCFEGFLPRKGKLRSDRLVAVAETQSVVVIFESPHRVGATLAEFVALGIGSRVCAVIKEITKLHEGVQRGTIADMAEVFQAKSKGEFVIVLDAAEIAIDISDEQILDELVRLLKQGESTKSAIELVASNNQIGKNKVYEIYLSNK